MTKFTHNRVKAIRIERGLSQHDLAKKLNISQSAYAKIENGVTKLDIRRLLQLSQVLEINPADLLIQDSSIFSINNDHAQGYVNNFNNGDLKSSYESHIKTLKSEIERLRNEIEFWKSKVLE